MGLMITKDKKYKLYYRKVRETFYGRHTALTLAVMKIYDSKEHAHKKKKKKKKKKKNENTKSVKCGACYFRVFDFFFDPQRIVSCQALFRVRFCSGRNVRCSIAENLDHHINNVPTCLYTVNGTFKR